MQCHVKIELLGYCLFAFGFGLPFLEIRFRWEPLLHAPVYVDLILLLVPIVLGLIFISYGMWKRVIYRNRTDIDEHPHKATDRDPIRTGLTMSTTAILMMAFITSIVTKNQEPWIYLVFLLVWLALVVTLLLYRRSH